MYGRHTALYTRCCEYKNSSKKSIPLEQPNQNKEMKIAHPVLLSLVMRDKSWMEGAFT